MVGTSTDPTVISVIVVRADDVATALETNLTSDEHAVLRLTPPFSGRMRARLHIERGTYEETPQPIHVAPETLVDDKPAYPRPADTETQIREDPNRTYSVESHHDYHTERVTNWRQTIGDCIRDQAQISTPTEPHEVTVAVLGN
jgi:hypothetical protein